MNQLYSLRAIGILNIMLEHFLPEATRLKSLFSYFGYRSVHMFFILSGFHITDVLLHNYKQNNLTHRDFNVLKIIKNFYIHRIVRLLPIYYLTIIIVIFFNFEIIKETLFWHLTFLTNFYFYFKGNWSEYMPH